LIGQSGDCLTDFVSALRRAIKASSSNENHPEILDLGTEWAYFGAALACPVAANYTKLDKGDGKNVGHLGRLGDLDPDNYTKTRNYENCELENSSQSFARDTSQTFSQLRTDSRLTISRSVAAAFAANSGSFM